MPTASSLPTLSQRTASGDTSFLDHSGNALPETMLQFGTGAFLRGFVEYFLDVANQAGRRAGRVVLVGSTGSGRAGVLEEQDHLYTLATRGIENGAETERFRVIPVISRALSALEDWDEVLTFAASPDLTYVASNTTEVGITLDPDDDILANPPRSYPGKLTAVLFARAQAFAFSPDSGLVILPCELVESNGDTLRDIVLQLASSWNLGSQFIEWVASANIFCNTLVDRIVPGTPAPEELARLQQRLGYQDALLTVAEPYRLWAVEGGEAVRTRLAPLAVDAGVRIVDDITPYRVLKVRILNGAHTIMTPAAWLCGCRTVQEAVDDPDMGTFIKSLVFDEILPGLGDDLDDAESFAGAVLDRFGNPYIRHELLGITFQQTTKFRVRVVPSISAFLDRFSRIPDAMAFGVACFLLFQHPDHGPAVATRPQDDASAWWQEQWNGVDVGDATSLRAFVRNVLSDSKHWGTSLSEMPGLDDAVAEHLIRLVEDGPRAALEYSIHQLQSSRATSDR